MSSSERGDIVPSEENPQVDDATVSATEREDGLVIRSLLPAQVRQRREAALKSGRRAKSEHVLRLRYRRTRSLVRRVRERMPWLDAADEPALRAWAELEVIAAGLFDDLTTAGMLNASGDPRRALAEYRQLRKTQLAYMNSLGMTPEARMSLRVGDARARSVVLEVQRAYIEEASEE